MDEKLLKPYNPAETEGRIYGLWEKYDLFRPEAVADLRGLEADSRGRFSMVLPPPNVTGRAHMGHAATVTIEDILVRYKRMRGFKTLWLPGTDHAAIATQTKVEKELIKKEGKNRHDLGREEFLKRVETFAAESHDTIVGQIKKLGASLDWSREAYTLDEKRSLAVRTAFKTLHDMGLIYRGNRVINWDPKGQTTVSDEEIVYKEEKGKLYTFRYSADFPISIATTRPETKVGDTAVAVHPDDTRYKQYVGQEFDLGFAGTRIHLRVIADPAVDPEFGTGAVGVTPAHSIVDFEMAERHKLPMKIVINEFAKMTDEAGLLVAGLKVKDAREKVVAWLRENNLLDKEEEIAVNLATADRSGGIIEPLPKLQWFVSVNTPIKERGNKTLKELMREPIETGKIKIIPERFEKVYLHWIDNLRDWCISRQIWYGHSIPILYRGEETKIASAKELFLQRHGESTAVAKKVYAGHSDVKLTDKGRSDITLIGEKLRDKNITKIISSDLSRAKESAEIIARTLGISEIEVTPLAREINAGDAEGKPYSKSGSIIEAALGARNAESLEQIYGRARKVLEMARRKETKGNILLVSHGGFGRILQAVIDNIRPENYLEYDANKKREIDTLLKRGKIISRTITEDTSGWTQDSDTLDTWFSSGLWTFSTLGWPEQTPDLKEFHPTDVLETAYDILFFWVARMILMSEALLGDVPFRTVYIHGLVRDEGGKKMSKSLGNIIDPLDMIEQFGADAVRMSLIIGTSPGNDSRISADKIKAYKHFANKLWNISRYVVSRNPKFEIRNSKQIKNEQISKLQNLAKEVTEDMENFRFYLAAEKLYHYIWHEFADKYIEESKKKDDPETLYTLQFTLTTLLKLLHPFMPFITEEIWGLVENPENRPEKMLIIQPWPSATAD